MVPGSGVSTTAHHGVRYGPSGLPSTVVYGAHRHRVCCGAREAAAAQIYYDGMKRLSLKEKRTETIKSELEARQKEEEKQNTFRPTIFTTRH